MAFELLTKDEAASQARISRRYLDKRIAAGTGPDVLHIGRRALVRSDAFAAWIEGLSAQSQRKDAAAAVDAADPRSTTP